MKIILLEDVGKLGRAGDVVNVSDGYARNYMIPRKFAVEASPANLRQMEHKKALGAGQVTRGKQEAQELAEKLERISLILARQAGKEDKLFGSVTSKDLSEALAAEGLEVERKKILLDEPIKSVGSYEVPVRLHPEVSTKINVEVRKA
jgi:large subunit ribosomal protein L9